MGVETGLLLTENSLTTRKPGNSENENLQRLVSVEAPTPSTSLFWYLNVLLCVSSSILPSLTTCKSWINLRPVLFLWILNALPRKLSLLEFQYCCIYMSSVTHHCLFVFTVYEHPLHPAVWGALKGQRLVHFCQVDLMIHYCLWQIFGKSFSELPEGYEP